MQGVVNEMNRILEALLPEDGIRVELLRWESNVASQIADGPQPVVNKQIESYDIFIGLLAKRFGTPTAVAQSGTEEEFRRAYELRPQLTRGTVVLVVAFAAAVMRWGFPPSEGWAKFSGVMLFFIGIQIPISLTACSSRDERP